MDCIEEKELSAYADGEVAAERAAALREHLNRCASCRAALSDLREIWDTLDELESAEPDPYFAARLARRAAARRRGGGGRRVLVSAAAAAAAVSLLPGVFLGQALFAESSPSATDGNGELAAYFGAAPMQDFPAGSLGETWGDVWTEGDGE
jgi:anti-sigma factor RsiW